MQEEKSMLPISSPSRAKVAAFVVTSSAEPREASTLRQMIYSGPSSGSSLRI